MNNWDKSIKAITSAVDRTDYLYEKWAKKLGVNNYVSRILSFRKKDILYLYPMKTTNAVK